MKQTRISNDELRELPLQSFDGKIVLVDSYQKFNEVITILNKSSVLGFDTETKPTFRKGKINKVALLQLANSDYAFLFRLNKIGLPKALLKILSNKNILKVGVAIHDDIKSLKKISYFKEAGFLELQDYVKTFGIENFGLKKLAGLILKIRISKNKQLSNWEQRVLNSGQLKYAATDAWAAYKVYQKLIAKLTNQ